MLELAGTSQRDAAAQSKMVLDFEAELARSVMPIAENSTRRRLPTSWTWPG
jgi:hypothetical protein